MFEYSYLSTESLYKWLADLADSSPLMILLLSTLCFFVVLYLVFVLYVVLEGFGNNCDRILENHPYGRI